MCRLEKLRSKLEREISSQKPSIEQIGKKKEELSKNLELSADKEIALTKEFELAMQNLGNEEMKQIVSDAMRMKQLEVLHSSFYVALLSKILTTIFFFNCPSGCPSRDERPKLVLNKSFTSSIRRKCKIRNSPFAAHENSKIILFDTTL